MYEMSVTEYQRTMCEGELDKEIYFFQWSSTNNDHMPKHRIRNKFKFNDY
jgi:hypothetical protein